MRTNRAFDTQAHCLGGAGMFATNSLRADRASFSLGMLVAISDGDVFVRKHVANDPVEAKANMMAYRQLAARYFLFFSPHSIRKRESDNEESSHSAFS